MTGNQTITAPLAQAVIPGHSTIDISQLGQALANSQQTLQQVSKVLRSYSHPKLRVQLYNYKLAKHKFVDFALKQHGSHFKISEKIPGNLIFKTW